MNTMHTKPSEIKSKKNYLNPLNHNTAIRPQKINLVNDQTNNNPAKLKSPPAQKIQDFGTMNINGTHSNTQIPQTKPSQVPSVKSQSSNLKKRKPNGQPGFQTPPKKKQMTLFQIGSLTSPISDLTQPQHISSPSLKQTRLHEIIMTVINDFSNSTTQDIVDILLGSKNILMVKSNPSSYRHYKYFGHFKKSSMGITVKQEIGKLLLHEKLQRNNGILTTKSQSEKITETGSKSHMLQGSLSNVAAGELPTFF